MERETVMLKRCSKCSELLPRSEFHKRSDNTDGLRNECKACKNGYNRRYRQENKERVAAYNKRYCEENKEAVAASGKRYREENKETIAAYKKRWWSEHKEKCREQKAASQRAWRRNNPAKKAANARRRYARKRGAEGSHTAAEFKALCASAAWKCLRCGMPHDVRLLTADHIVPLSKGGADDISNIQPLCRNCNSHKRTQTTDYRNAPWWACAT